jgi:hypothetical protein
MAKKEWLYLVEQAKIPLSMYNLSIFTLAIAQDMSCPMVVLMSVTALCLGELVGGRGWVHVVCVDDVRCFERVK